MDLPNKQIVIGVDLAARPKAAAIRLNPFEFLGAKAFMSDFDGGSNRGLVHELAAFVRSVGAIEEDAVLGVPMSRSSLLLARVPASKSEKLTDAMRWELRRLAPSASDLWRANWAEWPLSLPEPPGVDPNDRGLLYLIATADDAWVDRACGVAKRAGVRLAAVEPSAIGAGRAAWFARTGALDPRDARFSLTVVMEEETYICYGFGPSVWGARRVVAHVNTDEEFAAVMPGEILRAVRFVQGAAARDVAVTALGPEYRCQMVRDIVRQRVQEDAVLWVEANGKPVGEFAVAIGLAMRQSGGYLL